MYHYLNTSSKQEKKGQKQIFVLEAKIRCSIYHRNAFFISRFLIQGPGERRPYSPAHVYIYMSSYVYIACKSPLALIYSSAVTLFSSLFSSLFFCPCLPPPFLASLLTPVTASLMILLFHNAAQICECKTGWKVG